MSGTAVGDHLSDVKTLRENARAHIGDGPLTANYGADRKRVITVLNEALATELVCVLRYKRHYYMAEGINSAPVAAEFLQHAAEEQGHADQIAARIVQLQGEPDFNPATLVQRSHAEYVRFPLSSRSSSSRTVPKTWMRRYDGPGIFGSLRPGLAGLG